MIHSRTTPAPAGRRRLPSNTAADRLLRDHREGELWPERDPSEAVAPEELDLDAAGVVVHLDAKPVLGAAVADLIPPRLPLAVVLGQRLLQHLEHVLEQVAVPRFVIREAGEDLLPDRQHLLPDRQRRLLAAPAGDLPGPAGDLRLPHLV